MRTPKGLSPLHWTLLHLIDDGVSVSMEDARGHVLDGDVVVWLTDLAGEWERERGVLALARGDAHAMANIQDVLDRHLLADEPGAFAVANNGLCLLLGFCIDELQILLSADAVHHQPLSVPPSEQE